MSGPRRPEFVYVCPHCRRKRLSAAADPRCFGCGRSLTGAKQGRSRMRVSGEGRRRDGCIVTARLPNGELRSIYQGQATAIEALRGICDSLPRGSEVESISTARTILRDLGYPRRLVPMPPRDPELSDVYNPPPPLVDPFSVERALLSKIGRQDLLPVRMRKPPTAPAPYLPLPRGGFYAPEAAQRRRRRGLEDRS